MPRSTTGVANHRHRARGGTRARARSDPEVHHAGQRVDPPGDELDHLARAVGREVGQIERQQAFGERADDRGQTGTERMSIRES
jgi:hypothetical protein